MKAQEQLQMIQEVLVAIMLLYCLPVHHLPGRQMNHNYEVRLTMVPGYYAAKATNLTTFDKSIKLHK